MSSVSWSLDIRYPLFWPFGVLKTVEAVCGFAAMISYFCLKNWDLTLKGFILFTAIAVFILSLVFIIINIFKLPDSGFLKKFPFLLFELIHCLIWIVCTFLSFILAIYYINKYDHFNLDSCMTAIAIFMAIGCIAFALNAFLLRKHVQISCVRTSSTTTTTR